MSISEHSNGLASTIEFRCNRKKQDKRLSNHHFSLHITQQTIYNSGDPCYAASKWYSINFQWVFVLHLIWWGRERITELLGILNLPWQGFEKNIYKNWNKCRHVRISGEIFSNWGSSSDQNKISTRTKQSVICQLLWYIIQGKKQKQG